MTPPSIDQLLDIERQLDRSFVVSVVLLLALLGLPVYLRLTDQYGQRWAAVLAATLGVALLASYVWFAVSVSRTVKALGRNWRPYLAWLVLAPLFFPLAFCLPIPLLPWAIAASPLSLKFLLSGQLRSEIHDRTFAEG
jgi:hypothetical protein